MQRQSNIELLRVASMIMVLGVHIDGASLGLPEAAGEWGSLVGRDVWRLAVEAICIIGVNCFTIISGYFGIRLTLRKVFAFLFECIFYSVGLASIAFALFPHRFGVEYWCESWLVLTHTDLWYVPAYFILMLAAPALNFIVERAGKRCSLILVLLLSVVNVWFGWWNGATFNPTGYTHLQLMWIYIIGRYIGLYCRTESIRRVRIPSVMIYILSIAAIFASAVYMPSLKAFAYNSPFVMAATISAFALCAGFEFNSRKINYLAKSAFAVYLIHKNPLVWGNVMKPLVIKLWGMLSLSGFTLCAIAIAVLFYSMAALVDPVRRTTYCRLEKFFVNLPSNLKNR